ncbi:MAG: DUF3108 domain-containing protein [Porticoccaceae bacterium]|nr:DUF3108 domain-containing protein [Porticoccaceae bacterium]
MPFSYLQAESFPAPYEIIYVAKYNGMDVEAKHELIVNENSYQLLATVKGLLGGMTEREDFHIDQRGRIRPDSYKAEKSFFGVQKTEILVVDQAANKAIYTRKKKHRELSMLPNYLGPVSYQLQLRRDLEAFADLPSDALNPSSSFTYKVLSRGKIKDYTFEVLGEEVLDTPLGPLPTFKLQRVRDGGKRKTIFWMAPDWEFLVVKIRQNEKDGEQYEMLIKTATIRGQAMSLATEKAAL